ncbi:MAG TPA: tetratricopeptide repeat protein [Candidatus Acidoferrales bacterium]|nr:tetratricopeptide repeat protein [Candidatus Acidoferrales bacterium]
MVRTTPYLRILTGCAALTLCGAAALASSGSRKPQQSAPAGTNLGAVSFSVSCAPDVQSKFDTGVALLHSFQYQQAEQAFQDIAKADPTCAIAYWGEAMSLYHQLWDWPSPETLSEGRADIMKAFRPAAKTEREREYVRAAAVFFQDNPKLTHAQRLGAYSEVMGKLFKKYDDDVNAGAFYALCLVAMPTNSKADELANRKAAIDILDKLFIVAPRNPGVAHYLIHAADTPELASQGLAAARRYARIAPDSSHALHMPSHIFVRLGMWQDTISSNLAAADSAARATAANLADSGYQFHAMDFLDYAYLQSGQAAKARALVDELKNVVGASAQDIAINQALFAARNAIELRQWKEAAALPIPDIPITQQDDTYFARGIGAARSGDAVSAQAALDKLKDIHAAQHAQMQQQGYGMSMNSGGSVSEQELEAWITFAQGKSDDAVKQMRVAADREDAAGVDSLTLPAREMLGDILMELHRPSEALEAYKIALKESPKRFDSLDGAALAAEAAGKATEARQFFAQLVATCGPGADRPELEDARVHLAKK